MGGLRTGQRKQLPLCAASTGCDCEVKLFDFVWKHDIGNGTGLSLLVRSFPGIIHLYRVWDYSLAAGQNKGASTSAAQAYIAP